MSVPSPRVFISYAWEDDEYRLWVKQLATRLRADGVDARLDTWHLGATDFVTDFMSREIRQARWVLVLCSPGYRSKVHATEDEERSTGVGWEARLLNGRLFAAAQNKIIAALARGSWTEAAPDFLLGGRYDDLSDPQSFEDHYRDLLQRLTGTLEKAPPLGKLPVDLEPEPVEPLRGPTTGQNLGHLDDPSPEKVRRFDSLRGRLRNWIVVFLVATIAAFFVQLALKRMPVIPMDPNETPDEKQWCLRVTPRMNGKHILCFHNQEDCKDQYRLAEASKKHMPLRTVLPCKLMVPPA